MIECIGAENHTWEMMKSGTRHRVVLREILLEDGEGWLGYISTTETQSGLGRYFGCRNASTTVVFYFEPSGNERDRGSGRLEPSMGKFPDKL